MPYTSNPFVHRARAPFWFTVFTTKNRLLHLLTGRPQCQPFTLYNAAAEEANKLVKGEFTLGIWTVKRFYVEYGWPLI